MCILLLVKWVMTFAVSVSAWLFYILGTVFTLAGILSFGFGQEPFPVMLQMVVVGFIISSLPRIGTWCIAGVEAGRLLLKEICR